MVLLHVQPKMYIHIPTPLYGLAPCCVWPQGSSHFWTSNPSFVRQHMTYFLMGLWWGLNKSMNVKCFALCLVHSRINIWHIKWCCLCKGPMVVKSVSNYTGLTIGLDLVHLSGTFQRIFQGLFNVFPLSLANDWLNESCSTCYTRFGEIMKPIAGLTYGGGVEKVGKRGGNGSLLPTCWVALHRSLLFQDHNFLSINWRL